MSPLQPQTSNPPGVAAPRPTYTHVAITPLAATSKLITVAGQIGVHPDTGQAPAGYAAQVAQALSNLKTCLESAGATTRDIVKVTHYVVGADNIADPARGEAYVRLMGDHRPPSTLVGVAALAAPEYLYEIEAMAVVNS